jgi:uncharacterized protein YdeI (YjbR/CyaY-like superfamily)
MEITRTLYVTNRADWRAWLERHHETETEVWLIYYKKHSGRLIPYDDAVEEALCFGWIDSTVKRIDDEKFAQRFTPRKAKSEWSELNLRRVRALIKEGKMTRAGLARISEEALSQPSESKSKQARDNEIVIPGYFIDALNANKKARENFNNMASSYRRDYVRWVTSGKKEETRAKRLKEAIELLTSNKKPGMK